MRAGARFSEEVNDAMKQAILLYFISEFFLSVGIGVVQYAQPFFYAAANIGDANIGYLIAINAFFGGLSALVASPIADSIGASHMFKLGTLLIGVGDFAIALGHSVSVWMVTTAIAGIGGSMLASTENVVLSSLLTGRDRAHLISRFTALYMSMIGAGIVLSGVLVTYVGLRETMIIGASTAMVAPIIRYFVKAPDTKRSKWLTIPSRPLVFMAVYAILFGVAGGLFNPFATLILNTRYHVTNTTTAIVYAIGIFMISFGSFLVRPLIRRLKQGPTLLLAFVSSAWSTLLLLFAATASLFVGVYFLMTAITAIPPPVIDAMFLDSVHVNEFSQMFGMRVFGVRVGNAIGSSIGGGLLKWNQYHLLIILSALFFIVSYLYLLFVQRRILQHSDPRDDLSRKQP